MATTNASLSDPMKERVERQARSGRHSNASGHVRVLIRRDQERADRLAELRGLIAEGLESDVSERSVGEVLEAARQQARNARDDGL